MKKIALSTVMTFILSFMLLFVYLFVFTGVFGTPKLIYINSPDKKGFFIPDSITELTDVSLKDIYKIKYCRNLEKLEFTYDNELGSVDFLDNPNLKTLILNGKYSDLEGVEKCPDLEILYVTDYKTSGLNSDFSESECYVSSLKYICECSKLKELKLSVKNSLDLDGIEKLENLEKVYLSAESIDCGRLADCSGIEYIALGAANKSRMQLKNSQELLKMKNLKTADLSDCIFENGIPVKEELSRKFSEKKIEVTNLDWV